MLLEGGIATRLQHHRFQLQRSTHGVAERRWLLLEGELVSVLSWDGDGIVVPTCQTLRLRCG